jgi:hypothetical protein
MQPVVRSIGELPFVERDPLELLNLHIPRDLPDHDHAGFGFCRVAAVALESPADGATVVEAPLVLALHSADDGRPLPDDIELMFVLDATGDDVVTVLLSAFLRCWLPVVRGTERAIVLVMCNPHAAAIPRSGAPSPLPVHYAVGDVHSWLDPASPGPAIRLSADAWRLVA